MTFQCKIDRIFYIDGLAQACSNFIADALELLQSSTKPSIYFGAQWGMNVRLSLLIIG